MGSHDPNNCALRFNRVIDGVSLDLKPTDVIRNVSLGHEVVVDAKFLNGCFEETTVDDYR